MTNASPAPLDGYAIYDPADPYENLAGPFHWRQRKDGAHHFVLKAHARHCNRFNIVHGGLMMTMIDLTMVVAAKKNPEEMLVTVSLNTEFVDSGREGDLIEGIGELVRRTGSLAFVRGRLFTGGRTLLNASAVLKIIASR